MSKVYIPKLKQIVLQKNRWHSRNCLFSVLNNPNNRISWWFSWQQKILQVCHLANFMTFKNEDYGRVKSYTLISSTSLLTWLCCMLDFSFFTILIFTKFMKLKCTCVSEIICWTLIHFSFMSVKKHLKFCWNEGHCKIFPELTFCFILWYSLSSLNWKLFFWKSLQQIKNLICS